MGRFAEARPLVVPIEVVSSLAQEPSPMICRNPSPSGIAMRALIVLGILALVLAWPDDVRAQVGAEESAKKVKPAEGLEATLWASEPLVVNPTNMDIDSRGRVWITEGLNYRLTHGNKPFKRIEEADAIKILEDTDGDGKADKVTVFADKIWPIPMGLAVEEKYGADGKYQGCKVYIGNSPDILVFEDTDGDDKADKRSVLLTGFGGIDSDHGVHGMVLGLDGKLYFTHGDGCCSYQEDHSHKVQNFDVVDKSGRHVSSDQLANTLRVNRDGSQFEILADRQRNNYETSLNSFGNMFTSDNDDDGNRGSRVIWVMDGGKYGYRTQGSARHWGEDVPGNVPKLVGTGNGSPCGIMVYEGDLLPKEYYGGVFEADAGTRQINFFPITRKGAAFRTEAKVLFGSDDPWFRPVDMTAAPDGSVFVADWYDAGVGGHAFRDQTTGRIYRVAPSGSKTKSVKYDFATVPGLIEALKSPVVATQDAARRSLIARGKDTAVTAALGDLFFNGANPIHKARALWVWHAIDGDPIAMIALTEVGHRGDARIREQAVRMLGRDCRENGKVEYANSDAKLPPPGLKHLDILLAMADDPDAGVRREVILALRNLATDKVGGALRRLAASWDGQDRWYLEALGLALDKRESDYISSLFDGTLFGDLDQSAQSGSLAVPPYFPTDRNEAYIPTEASDPPASAMSKTLGLAWRLHRAEVLPLLSRVLPSLATPELQQAADDVLAQMRDPQTALMLASLASKSDDQARKRQLIATLGRKLDTAWHGARTSPEIVALTTSALADPGLRLEAVGLAAATGDARYAPALVALVRDAKSTEEVKAVAVESAARIDDPTVKDLLISLIERSKGSASSTLQAQAAVRSLMKVEDPRRRLLAIMEDAGFPIGLRREALRTFVSLSDGGSRMIAMARDGKLPADLKTEATTALAVHPDRRVRMDAAEALPMPKTRGGEPLPPFFQLVRAEGKAERGRDVFFRAGTNSCGSCHRVQGRGQWIGPDLSTIGVKYGRDELVRSILNPSAAIGYNFRSLVVALTDGRILTGLPIEDGPDRLVLKAADGQRIAIRPAQIEERKSSDVSLMPEGLAETMTNAEIIDLLTFLSSLKQPVSIVGQYQAIGPVSEANGSSALDPAAKIDLAAGVRGENGRTLSWRRLDANAESIADLTTIAGDDGSKVAYLYAPVYSPSAQTAKLVLDSKSDVKVWLNGRALNLPEPSDDQTRTIAVDLPQGASELVIRAIGGAGASIVTTFAADKPVAFQGGAAKIESR